MRGLKKNYMKRGQNIPGHCDSMKDLAKGQFFEKHAGRLSLLDSDFMYDCLVYLGLLITGQYCDQIHI